MVPSTVSTEQYLLRDRSGSLMPELSACFEEARNKTEGMYSCGRVSITTWLQLKSMRVGYKLHRCLTWSPPVRL